MKVLYVTTVSLTVNTFFKSHISMLTDAGYKVDIACNFRDMEPDELYEKSGCGFCQIDFSRSPFSFDNVKAYGQLKKAVENGGYDIVHCHTPIASAITRLVCRRLRKKNKLKVFYTAHGFHFYKGAPKFNWLMFYPVEKLCARFTDKLITINKEDHELAKRNFGAKEVHYVPGVGVDFSRFYNIKVDRCLVRKNIGVPENAFVIFSAGELNENKNHQIIIKAIAKLEKANIHYVIAGEGNKKDFLLSLAKKLGLESRVHFLGYRNDIPELNYSADLFCFPSIREGLGLSAIEAMACGTAVIASDNRGIRSFISDGVNGFICKSCSADEFADAINKLMNNSDLRKSVSEEGKKSAECFSEKNVLMKMKEIYFEQPDIKG